MLLRQLELGSEDRPFVLIGVIRTEGPTAIKSGNKAIILSDGTIEGWVGGHCTEDEIVRNAKECLKNGETRVLNLSTCQGGRMDVYLEPYLSKRKLVIFGHVPIVASLCKMAKSLNFRVIVVDKTATREAFPDANATFTSFEEFRAEAKSRRDSFEQTYAVVASMGEHDQEQVLNLSELDLPYIGVIAGRKRASDLVSYLRGSEVSETRLSKIRSPAGIYIRAITAQEIALSILAEIVDIVRTKSSGAQESLRIVETSMAKESQSLGKVPEVEAKSEGKVFVDPVCGMTVDSSSQYTLSLPSGPTVYFCCESCREAFKNGPENYILEETG